ncbi:MAG TPA: formate dehydrogenase accessory protein FdhE [Desulfuromonadaceae bacterium]
MSPDSRIVEPGRMEAPAGAIRFLSLPGPDLFAVRAGRFLELSGRHPLGDYFSFLALLAEAQQHAMERFPAPGKRTAPSDNGEPPLHALTIPRESAWREGLAMILERMEGADLPEAARETIAALSVAGESALEDEAERILSGNLANVAPRRLPFVSAALQLHWVRMAQSLEEGAVGLPQEAARCPVCGSPPVGGVVRGSGAERGLRYLSCSLCAAQWHRVRITCSNCAATGGIDYYTLKGSDGAVKAESCEGCGTYLKLFYLEKESRMEAMADDLATISLDMLMAEEGKARSAVNLFFHPGSEPG